MSPVLMGRRWPSFPLPGVWLSLLTLHSHPLCHPSAPLGLHQPLGLAGFFFTSLYNLLAEEATVKSLLRDSMMLIGAVLRTRRVCVCVWGVFSCTLVLSVSCHSPQGVSLAPQAETPDKGRNVVTELRRGPSCWLLVLCDHDCPQ